MTSEYFNPDPVNVDFGQVADVSVEISQDKSLWYFGQDIPAPSGFTLGATAATLTANNVGNGTYIQLLTGLDSVSRNTTSTLTNLTERGDAEIALWAFAALLSPKAT